MYGQAYEEVFDVNMKVKKYLCLNKSKILSVFFYSRSIIKNYFLTKHTYTFPSCSESFIDPIISLYRPTYCLSFNLQNELYRVHKYSI